MSGVRAAREESNGGATAVVANSSATRPAIGTPGITIAATRTARARSQVTITARRGSHVKRPRRNRSGGGMSC